MKNPFYKLLETFNELEEGGMLDKVGRKMKVKTTNGVPNPAEAPNWANYMAQNGEGSWFWLERESEPTGNSDRYYPNAGKMEFTGYVSEPDNWEHSITPVNNLTEAGTTKVRKIGNQVEVTDAEGNKTMYDEQAWEEMNKEGEMNESLEHYDDFTYNFESAVEGISDAALLHKVAQVVKSVQTPEQYRTAEKYLDLAFNKLKADTHKTRTFDDGYERLLSILKAFESDLNAKAAQLGITSGVIESEDEEDRYATDFDIDEPDEFDLGDFNVDSSFDFDDDDIGMDFNFESEGDDIEWPDNVVSNEFPSDAHPLTPDDITPDDLDPFGEHEMFDEEIIMVPEEDELPSNELLGRQTGYDDEFPDMRDVDDFDEPEYKPFDLKRDGKRLRPGTPIVFSDDIGGGTGVFIEKSPSGAFGTAERNGRTISIHLNDIEMADLVHKDVYEDFDKKFNAIMEEITVVRTNNAEDPENDTITITGTGEHVDMLTDIMKLAGMEGGDGKELPQDAEIPVNIDPGMEQGMGMKDMMGMMNPEPMESIEEGDLEESIVDDFKKGAKKAGKWMKRGMQGWDMDYADPEDMMQRHNEYDTDTLHNLESDSIGSNHSPAGLQQKLINRELRRRGERDFAKYGDSRKMTDEEFSNEPNDATELAADVDGMVNGHSGGLNKQKKHFRKEYPGDNIMSANLEEAKKQERYTVYNSKTNTIIKPNLTKSAAEKLADTNADYEYGSPAWVEDRCRKSTNESADSFLNLYKKIKFIDDES